MLARELFDSPRRRRVAIALACFLSVSPLAAQDHTTSVPLAIRDASRAIQAGNAPLFLSAFEGKSITKFESFSSDVRALLAQKTVASSVSTGPVTVESDEAAVTVDWLLRLRPQNGIGPIETRREQVSLKLRRQGKKWKITGLDAQHIFSPRPQGP